MSSWVRDGIKASIAVKQALLERADIISDIDKIGSSCADAYRRQKKVLVAGNGGSAADAQHFAAELVSRFAFDRPGLPAIALTTDTSILTAIANDYGYERVFARQIEAHGQEGDIFLAISTSGNSRNVLEAIQAARKGGLKVFGLTGESGGKMRDLCDITVRVPSADTPRIQECHIVIAHMVCDFIESSLFKS